MATPRSTRAHFFTASMLGLTALLVGTATLLAGCGKTETPEVQQQLDHPRVSVVGTFDGCEVKYVDRFYKEKSFYIARCAPAPSGAAMAPTETTTGFYNELAGTRNEPHQQVAITTSDPVSTEQSLALLNRQKALDKLTELDRAALGLPPRPQPIRLPK